MHFYNGHQVKLLLSGQPFFDELLRLIGEARVFIHLQTYILDYDKTGAEVIDALKAATKRGVMVMVVADGYGTRLPDEVIADMQQAGIETSRAHSLAALTVSAYEGALVQARVAGNVDAMQATSQALLDLVRLSLPPRALSA